MMIHNISIKMYRAKLFNSAHRISCFKSVSIMLTRPVPNQILHNTESHAQSHQTQTSFVCFSYEVFMTVRLTWVWTCGVSGAARRRRDGVGVSFKIFLDRSLILLEPRLKDVFNGHGDFKLSGIMY